MSAAAVVSLIAMIATADGDLAVLDRGRADGLRPGDVGRVYYTLLVGDDRQPRVIDCGTARVIEARPAAAVARAAPGTSIRPGFEIEFEVPRDRLAPSRPVSSGGEPTGVLPNGGPPDDGVASEVVGSEPDAAEPVPSPRPRASWPAAEALPPAPAPPLPLLPAPAPETTTAPPPAPDRIAEEPPMIAFPAGIYEIGNDLESARFYNQTPRFRRSLPAFRIDRRAARRPGSGRFLTGLTHAEAAAHCASRGLRLPSELEWEIALLELGQQALGPPHEWTASWYRPYPANAYPETEYGETYRVLRGRDDDEIFDARRRRFMAPGSRRPEVGFRCAGDAGRR